MGSTLKYFLWIICMTKLVFSMIRLLEVEEKEERLETEVLRVKSTSSGDYSSDLDWGGVGLRCSVQNSDKILSRSCRFQ